MSKIIYLKDDGVIAIIHPVLTEINLATGKNWTLEEIAKKDVPTGKKYKVVEDSDIPTDYSFRDAWTVSESDLIDGVGS
tara:strand:- start:326 stop:562 length:237 start_codon:yes stop_codon:yes gene_type:complete